ncbi:hypothetical protein HYU16_03970 [Candidatus Woesearchaeota archaeon]|nr:hypothetical protein [Candidatus Woesearchaeota archaeon]
MAWNMNVGRLYCTSCNYQFVPKTDKMPTRCPYCDKDGTLEKATQAQDLIDEISRETVEREEREKH